MEERISTVPSILILPSMSPRFESPPMSPNSPSFMGSFALQSYLLYYKDQKNKTFPPFRGENDETEHWMQDIVAFNHVALLFSLILDNTLWKFLFFDFWCKFLAFKQGFKQWTSVLPPFTKLQIVSIYFLDESMRSAL